MNLYLTPPKAPGLTAIKWGGIVFMAGFLVGGSLTLWCSPRSRPAVVLDPAPARMRKADLAAKLDLAGQLSSGPVKIPSAGKSFAGVLPEPGQVQDMDMPNISSGLVGHPEVSRGIKTGEQNAGFLVGDKADLPLDGALTVTITDARTGQPLTSTEAALEGQLALTFTGPRELQADMIFGHSLNLAIDGRPPPLWTYEAGLGWGTDGPCGWGQVRRRLIGGISLCAEGFVSGGDVAVFAGMSYRWDKD